MTTLPFVKMHGIGNDFVVLDARQRAIEIDATRARALADRRFGIGCDQVLVVEPSERAAARMRIFNPDGSEVEMCGNGLRCIARFLRENGHAGAEELTIETDSGIARATFEDAWVRVELGAPIWDGRSIPVDVDGEVIEQRLEGFDTPLSCVSMGNPHAVLFVPELDDARFARLGPPLETHPFFPRRTNVELVRVLSEQRIRVRVWERGVGETLACGSGAAASGVMAIRLGHARSPVTVELPGGALEIGWDGSGPVSLSGPAEVAYRGEVDPDHVGRG